MKQPLFYFEMQYKENRFACQDVNAFPDPPLNLGHARHNNVCTVDRGGLMRLAFQAVKGL